MELQHVNVKIFAEHPERIAQEEFTPIFQKWIQDRAGEELLIDVVDYLHIDAGPGIVLIGHEADYSMDDTDHRLGLRYNRKTALAGDNSGRFRQALRAALQACLRLEGEPRFEGKLKFNRQELELFINDRALAPNTPQTYSTCAPELKSFLESALGQSIEMKHHSDPRLRFGISVKTAQAWDIGAVLKKLS